MQQRGPAGVGAIPAGLPRLWLGIPSRIRVGCHRRAFPDRLVDRGSPKSFPVCFRLALHDEQNGLGDRGQSQRGSHHHRGLPVRLKPRSPRPSGPNSSVGRSHNERPGHPVSGVMRCRSVDGRSPLVDCRGAAGLAGDRRVHRISHGQGNGAGCSYRLLRQRLPGPESINASYWQAEPSGPRACAEWLCGHERYRATLEHPWLRCRRGTAPWYLRANQVVRPFGCVISQTLPLQLEPSSLHPLGRPGRSETQEVDAVPSSAQVRT